MTATENIHLRYHIGVGEKLLWSCLLGEEGFSVLEIGSECGLHGCVLRRVFGLRRTCVRGERSAREDLLEANGLGGEERFGIAKKGKGRRGVWDG